MIQIINPFVVHDSSGGGHVQRWNSFLYLEKVENQNFSIGIHLVYGEMKV